jgi:hypothetical protein
MKIGDNIHRIERGSASPSPTARRPADRDMIFRLLSDGLETWYNIRIRGTGDKIIHAIQGKMIFIPGDRVRLEADIHRPGRLRGLRQRRSRTEDGP